MERVGPSLWLALLPLPTAFISFPVLFLIGEDAGRLAAQGVMALAWLSVLVASVRVLRRHWTGSPNQPTWSLLGAACVALASWLMFMHLGSPWQELMSEPQATPAMVAMDLVANFGPFLVSAVSACVVLVLFSSERPSGA